MVGTGGNFVEARGLVRFDLSSVPAGSVVTEARLELTLVALEGGATTIDLRRALAAWTETTVTWDNQPGGASPFSSLVVGTDLLVYEWPVTDVVRDWVSGAAANRGLVLHGTGGLRGFGSRERLPLPFSSMT
jgi:hypothetical protein